MSTDTVNVYEASFKRKLGKNATLQQYDREWEAWYKWCGHDRDLKLDRVAVYLNDYSLLPSTTVPKFRRARAMLCGMLDAIHGGDSASHRLIRSASKAAASRAPMTQRKKKLPSYFELADGFVYVAAQLRSRDVFSVRRALLFALAADLHGRASDLASVVGTPLQLEDKQVTLYLADTKEMRTPHLEPVTIECYEQNTDWCSVCLLREYLSLAKAWPVRPTILIKSGGTERKAPALFGGLRKKGELQDPLKPQTISSILRKEVLAPLGWHDKGYTVHNLRGASASKLVNLGWTVPEVQARGRWTEDSDTFEKMYLRRQSFVHVRGSMSPEAALRVRPSPAGVGQAR